MKLMWNKSPILALVVIFLRGVCLAGGWTSYTNTDAVRQIAIRPPYIWAATSGGATAYDPSDGGFQKLTNIDGLGSTDLRCVEVDTAGNLWFGADDGWLSRVSQSLAIRNYPIRDSAGLIARAVTIFDLKTEGDRLWVASDLGVSKFLIYSNGGEIKDTARKLGSLPLTEDAVCVEIIGPRLWVGTSRGIASIDKGNENIQYFGNWISYTQGQNGLMNADIRTILSYRDTVLAGTRNGVYKFTVSPDTQWQSIGLSDRTIVKLFMSDTMLIAATTDTINDGIDNGAVYRYGPSGWTTFPSTGLPRNMANDLSFEDDGTLWAGTPASGMAEFDGLAWTLRSIPGPASNIVNRLAIDSSGGLWMTHDSKGMSRMINGQWFLFRAPSNNFVTNGESPTIFDNEQTEISVALNGDIWASSFGGGLYRYQLGPELWYRWNAGNSPMYGVWNNRFYWAATGVRADKNGNIWVTAFFSGVANRPDSNLVMGVYAPYSSDSTWQLYMTVDIGLEANFAQTFLFNGDTVWVARGEGLSRLIDGGTPFDLSDDDWFANITNLNVVDMALDNAGVNWLATASGLFYMPLYADTVFSFDLPPEISGSVNAVETDGVGNIWVGSVAGLGVLRPGGENPSASRWDATYTTANSPLIDNKINGIVIDIPTGMVYIGTDGGLSVYDSGNLPPSPDLDDMSAFPNPVILGGGESLIEFKRIPSSGILTIYTAAGDRVARIDLSHSNTWDLRNEHGKRIAGGIYFFHVKSGEASGTGKFAVIR
ncbi:MAG: hypothetical protein A2W25_02550 [candidate division Zixibacteria bacterium RBG_16_53_22]|nr:MAG: hypothetical protein A2W25_02550 [candidate division Zixibacteria bacterium RBG_16_53_22]